MEGLLLDVRRQRDDGRFDQSERHLEEVLQMSTPLVAIRQAVDERARERTLGDGSSDRLDYVCGPTVSY